jgi:hypothetical protein
MHRIGGTNETITMPESATTGRTAVDQMSTGRTHLVTPLPTQPKVSAAAMYKMHAVLETNFFWRGFAKFVESHKPMYRVFTWAEEKTKHYLFGCRMCAQCALPTTAYACPQTCPKQLRNGPCGGVFPDGKCEVYPDMKCVWVMAYERADEAGHIQDLRRLVRPIDQRKWGQSSWINYWHDRDEDLWTPDDGLAGPEPPAL